MSSPATNFQLIVVGAGLRGLVCAYEAQKEGLRVAVLEARKRPGGALHTLRQPGLLLECGPESIPASSALKRLLEELSLEATPLQDQKAFKRNGQWVAYPQGLSPSDPATYAMLAPLLGLSARLRLQAEGLVGKGVLEDESVAGFFTRRLGSAAWDLLAPLVQEEWGGDPAQLSLRSAYPRLWQAENQHGSLARSRGQTLQTSRLTFAQGMGSLIDALGKALEGKVPFGSGQEVVGLQRKGQYWQVYTRQGQLEAESVVLACPAPAAARILRHVHPQATTLLNQIPHLPYSSVHLAFAQDQLPDDPYPVRLWEEAGGFYRLSRTRSRFPARVEEGFEVLRLDVVGEAARLSESVLARLALDQVRQQLGIAESSRVLGSWVFRQIGSLPQPTLGHHRREGLLEGTLSHLPGVFFAGGSLERAVADAEQAARRALGYLALSVDTPM
ncbi:protoporphyrinogen oxidase [Calidithermus roseus]|uniref:Coproporphyrinogen III oxidase n=1 Tax=Calidithermus roseus TaxID=1644118 RepID=A0A399EPA5_9DEIN|nr:protoporphyrinogen oxidase [Calidithermus roseus]RIH86457.1 Protoporphyrinogen oxidase [Calidithermus roseus]